MKTRLSRRLLLTLALSLVLPTLLLGGLGGAANSNGVVKVSLLVLTLNASTGGSGTFSGELNQNSNDGTQTTTFSTQSATGNYCINSDNITGVVTPGGACPLVFALDDGGAEIRLINSADQKAEAVVCRKQ
jgi:hypothetical protein